MKLQVSPQLRGLSEAAIADGCRRGLIAFRDGVLTPTVEGGAPWAFGDNVAASNPASIAYHSAQTGNLLVAWVSWNTATGTPSISDTVNGSTWSTGPTSPIKQGNGYTMQAFYKFPCGVGTPTVTASGTGQGSPTFSALWCLSFTPGAGLTFVLDDYQGTTGNVANPSINVTTTQVGDLIVGCCITDGSATQGANYTVGDNLAGNPDEYITSHSQAAGTVAVDFVNSTNNAAWIALAFKESSAAAPVFSVFFDQASLDQAAGQLGSGYFMGYLDAGPNPAGGVITPQALTATVTSTAVIQNVVNKVLSATSPTTALIGKVVNKAVTATATSTANIRKLVNKPLSATVTSLATITKVRTLLLSATVTSTASIVKVVNKPLTATATSTASMVKTVLKSLTGTVTSTATMQTIRVFVRTLTATVTSSATISKVVNKGLSASSTSSATITRIVNKALAATSTSTATITKLVNKVLSAPATSTATIAKTKVAILNLTATVTSSASITKVVNKSLQASATTTASITRVVNKLLSATATSTATISRIVNKLMSATAPTSATLQATKVAILNMVATVTSSASITKVVNKSLSATATSTATMRRVVSKALSASVTSTATITKVVSKTLVANASSLATMSANFVAGGVTTAGRYLKRMMKFGR